MNAGELRHRVTFQKRSLDPATGGLTAWADYVTVWAKVEDLSGRDYFQAQMLGEASLVTTRITVRWRPDLDPHMRVRFGDRLFDIKAILDPDGRRRVLQVMCAEAR
ncbi:phage head closure protein [Desulfovirgula thermocuniculi]|uniref:phage head closure protein n=1 Tax=Desulfovirgula thermocuniculi TaxID=348842 RepID=UPI00040953DF|nr:phage head closure protein [Desulfovirgula thermocuniculi]